MYRSIMSSKQQQQPVADQRNGVAESTDVETAKKRKYSNDRSSASTNDAQQRKRILSRKYLLTKTGYKYLELGIGIPMSMTRPTVEIAIGDTHGKELLLSSAMFTTLLQNRLVVTSYLLEQDDEPPQPIRENGLTVTFGRINNARIVRLETSACRLPLSAQTMCTFYTLRHCAECIIDSLHETLDRANDRLSLFAALASDSKENVSLARAAVQRGDFDATDLVDCELLAIVFNTAP